MNMHTAAFRRTEQVSSKEFAFSRIHFFPLISFVFIFFIYWIIGEKSNSDYIPTVYPVGKKKQPPLMACGVPVQTDLIIKVNNLKTYMVSSYIEHRHAVKMIQTIAIVLRSENTNYHCLLCCNGQNVSVPAAYEIHSDHFGFEYGTADITCKIPETCPTPTHVAITSPSPKENGSLLDVHAFQPVRNQQKLEVFPYEFTVCISTMFDFVNVLMLVQAMEMFKILGVQKVAIYKTSCDPVTQKVLDYYVRQNFVEIIPWSVSSYIKVSRGWQTSVSPGELHYFGQIAALNDCVYRYMYQSHYVALQDLDEFILPMNLNNWKELLPELERKYSQSVGFEFENNFFPLSIKDPRPEYSPDSWKKVTGVNILDHIYRLSNDPTKFNNFKVIVNPRLVFQTTVHGFLKSVGNSVRVDSKIARMYHMRNISEEIVSMRTQIRDARHRDYADQLIPAVSEVLQQALA
ncbi:beta-1,4-galactosyltransferase galt-1 isoform X3 [Neoarius graeffei]|uniref:beta-1,4-galactosyltransferase galt-1 isoform X3 n=1 Tax=Neoarius graeffei TaxID=443677 RepID=UPI00298BCFD1|nr:beta-1,4-galactosyltransferase galt-1 isoform X3 [Neoarius graeffei]